METRDALDGYPARVTTSDRGADPQGASRGDGSTGDDAGAAAGASPTLERRLGLGAAIVIGLSSMIGAGLFSAFGPAAQAAGGGLLIGLLLALVVAWCNATSTAQLAAQYPSSGGTYVYGRERLGEWPGFVAGWGFVIGKTASSAAMALTFAAYAAPAEWLKPVAVAALIALVAINARGITRTAALARILVAHVLAGLAVIVTTAWVLAGPSAQTGAAAMFDGLGAALGSGPAWLGILQSAGLLFFAFAGYARIATLGEEVREPERTIPRAIIVTLATVAVLYAIVAVTMIVTIGVDGIAASRSPLAETVAGVPWGTWLVGATAAIAALGALLAAIAGVSRTAFAMARNRDLPGWLDAIGARFRVPHRAIWVLGVGMLVLVLVGDIREVIGFSSAGVLLYYLIANVAAFTQRAPHRRYPRILQVIGALTCAVLIVTLPGWSLVGAGAVFAVGIAYRLLSRRSRRELAR